MTNASSRTNWAGNYRYKAAELTTPRSITELQDCVATAERCKALGTRHSFQNIADTPGTQISLEHLQGIALDRTASQVTVEAGVRYGELAAWLDAQGYALHNLASLPHISVAGACATATHGSGLHNGNLATAVAAVEMVTADGTIRRFARDENREAFEGAVVSLGALGVAARLTLDVQPSFQVAQTVYSSLPFAVLQDHLLDIYGAGYSVSLFTDWREARATQVWVKQRVKAETRTALNAEFFGARAMTEDVHPIEGHEAVHCTPQMGVAGAWHERLPHFRLQFTPSSGAELQTEYFVALEDAYAALCAVEKLKERIAPLLLVSELRVIAADDLWMSMNYRRASFALHFTWKPEWEQVRRVLPAIEAALEPFSVRAHWGKLFTLPPEKLAARYARIDDFRTLMRECDPRGKFQNAFLAPLGSR
uniref:FAD-binding protein n=1 Tax=Acidobacterium capsulatum TaxID=33075 RepID=A0A7V4XRB6_9BACT